MKCSRCECTKRPETTATVPEGWVMRIAGGETEYLCEFCVAGERAMRGKEAAMKALARV